jgi:hypothetical protein
VCVLSLANDSVLSRDYCILYLHLPRCMHWNLQMLKLNSRLLIKLNFPMLLPWLLARKCQSYSLYFESVALSILFLTDEARVLISFFLNFPFVYCNQFLIIFFIKKGSSSALWSKLCLGFVPMFENPLYGMNDAWTLFFGLF